MINDNLHDVADRNHESQPLDMGAYIVEAFELPDRWLVTRKQTETSYLVDLAGYEGRRCSCRHWDFVTGANKTCRHVRLVEQILRENEKEN